MDYKSNIVKVVPLLLGSILLFFIGFAEEKNRTLEEEQMIEENKLSDEDAVESAAAEIPEFPEDMFIPDSGSEAQNKEEDIDIPSKEEILSMRELVLSGMTEDEIERLTENIKVANSTMESAYLNDRIFNKLADPENAYWQYFDKAGDIQLGWWYNRQIVDKDKIMQMEGISEAEFTEREYEPGIVYNRFDADNFIEIIEDMQSCVENEMLRADMQQLIDLTYMAVVTHEMEYANQIYRILHDLDYFLLRYGIDDVGKYVQDTGTVSKYYGVLTIYGATPFTLNDENVYHILKYPNVEYDPTLYGEVEDVYEEFSATDGDLAFYYDMECFYFDDTFPVVLNETLQAYYDSIKESYIKDAQLYSSGTSEPNIATPYNELLFKYFTYVGDDYVSLVYNDVSYVGGAHPYSALEGITIDCITGEIVSVQQFLDDSTSEIGEQLQKVLGFDSFTPDNWDYYITDTTVVFFYDDPKYWDSVVTRRRR